MWRCPPTQRAALLASISLAILATPATAGTLRLVLPGSEWRYLDDGSDQGTPWRASLFDDSAWPKGPAQLGYGEGDELTIVRCRVGWPEATPCPGGGTADRIVTTYFRRAFAVDDPAAVSTLTLRLLVDDGAAVYLNGVEVLRDNMPAGALAFDTLASGPVLTENVFTDHALDPNGLVAGTNVLAVEVHQHDPSSSDVSFDLELAAEAPALPQLLRGPYLQLGTPASGVVRWRTDAATASRVVYGGDPAALDQTVLDPVAVTEHVVEIGGLAPATRYYYAIGTDTTLLAAGDAERFFATPPAAGTRSPVRVWVIGDSGTANAGAASVRDAYRRFAAGRAADVWLMLGDNAYAQGTDEQYQAAVFDMYPRILGKTWVWSTFGNHDAQSASSFTRTGPYFDIFTLPEAGEAGGLASGTEAYYSFDFANVHFICLDASDSDLSPGGAMMSWLEADANATSQDWIVAFWHHPPYTHGSHNSDNPLDSGGRLFAVREAALPILEAAGVDLVLTGHSHAYERSYLLHGHYGTSDTLTAAMILDHGDGRPAGDGAYSKIGPPGAVYAVAGSSGQTGGGSLDHPAMFVSLARLGSMVLDFDGLRLDAAFLAETGELLDEFTLLKVDEIFADGFESGDTAVWSKSVGSSP